MDATQLQPLIGGSGGGIGGDGESAGSGGAGGGGGRRRRRFKYSNTNYLRLSVIVSAAGDAHWSEQARSRLLDPLGLRNTFVDGFETTPVSPVRGYARHGTEFLDVTDTFHQSVASGAGCMVSDAVDLLRWSGALYGGEFLNEESMRQPMVENRVPYQDEEGPSDDLEVGLSNFIETGVRVRRSPWTLRWTSWFFLHPPLPRPRRRRAGVHPDRAGDFGRGEAAHSSTLGGVIDRL